MKQTIDTFTVVQLRMALACIALALLGGAVAVLHYIPAASTQLNGFGLTLTRLRPLHTTFASLWIYGAAIAVVYHYLAHRDGGLDRSDARRFWFHTVCWIVAGVSIFVTLILGVSSGREYLGFHPAFSLLLLLGWFAFAINFYKRARHDFFRQPVYVYFWGIGILFFVYTFIEGHAYLLPWVEQHPIRDLQIQWKSCGTLVGSFNFLVYGALMYVSERITGNRDYAQSKTAFMLFGVGCLNSFTNYAHHTYHLPQSHVVKWIAFIVSMLELVILLKVLYDLHRMVRSRCERDGRYCATTGFFDSARCWTGAMLFVSLLISIPSLNSFVHGTQVVTGHAMGTELGIDSMALFGGVTYLLADLYRRSPLVMARLDTQKMRVHRHALSFSAAALVAWLTLSGTVHGVYRYNGEPTPDWVGWGTFLFPILGFLVALSLLGLLAQWLPLLFGIERRRRLEVGDAAVGIATAIGNPHHRGEQPT